MYGMTEAEGGHGSQLFPDRASYSKTETRRDTGVQMQSPKCQIRDEKSIFIVLLLFIVQL